MRFLYVASVAVVALVMSANGLQVAPDSSESTSLRAVDGKTERFLVSEANDAPSMKTTAGYELPVHRKDDEDKHKRNIVKSDDKSSSFEERKSSSKSSRSKSSRSKRMKSGKKVGKRVATFLAGNEETTASEEGEYDEEEEEEEEGKRKKRRKGPLKRFSAWLRRTF